MSNKVTVSFGDVSINKTDNKTDLAKVSAKYTLRRGGKIVESKTFSTTFSGRSLRRLKRAEANGVFKDIERRATRRVVESLIINAAISGKFKAGDEVTVKAKRDVHLVKPEIVNVVADTVGCKFSFK